MLRLGWGAGAPTQRKKRKTVFLHEVFAQRLQEAGAGARLGQEAHEKQELVHDTTGAESIDTTVPTTKTRAYTRFARRFHC